MARNGSGTFSFTATNVAPAVTGTTIDSSAFNTTMTEIAAALTESVSKDGQTVLTGALDYDGNELILDVDGDTSITADTDDRIDFKIGASDIVSLDSTGILDANKNEILQLSTTASAVNHPQIANAATGNDPIISAVGGDTNIGMILTPKGTGRITNSTTVASYVSGMTHYIEDDVAADSTTFDIDANIGAAFESVGPTGSGATNIWTALDSVPTGATYLILKCFSSVIKTGTDNDVYSTVYARVTGSSTGTTVGARVADSRGSGTASLSARAENTATFFTPVDASIRFDLYLASDGTTKVITLSLVGWGI